MGVIGFHLAIVLITNHLLCETIWSCRWYPNRLYQYKIIVDMFFRWFPYMLLNWHNSNFYGIFPSPEKAQNVLCQHAYFLLYPSMSEIIHEMAVWWESKKTHSVPHSYPINPYQSTIHWVKPSPSRGRASCTAAALGGNAPVADAGGKLLWTSRQVVGGSWKLRYVTNEIGHVSVREKRNGVWVSLLYIYIILYIYVCTIY